MVCGFAFGGGGWGVEGARGVLRAKRGFERTGCAALQGG